jgi:hypothetical protein
MPTYEGTLADGTPFHAFICGRPPVHSCNWCNRLGEFQCDVFVGYLPPLRAVVSASRPLSYHRTETLECGHTIQPYVGTDTWTIHVRPAKRRRCPDCPPVGRTRCNKYLCAAHRTNLAPDKDACPDHKDLALAALERLKTAGVPRA